MARGTVTAITSCIYIAPPPFLKKIPRRCRRADRVSFCIRTLVHSGDVPVPGFGAGLSEPRRARQSLALSINWCASRFKLDSIEARTQVTFQPKYAPHRRPLVGVRIIRSRSFAGVAHLYDRAAIPPALPAKGSWTRSEAFKVDVDRSKLVSLRAVSRPRSP